MYILRLATFLPVTCSSSSKTKHYSVNEKIRQKKNDINSEKKKQSKKIRSSTEDLNDKKKYGNNKAVAVNIIP